MGAATQRIAPSHLLPGTPGRRTPLRLVPPLRKLRRRRPRRRHGDAVFATTLCLLLGFGIVGVLLLNTAMQTQADRIATSRHRLASLMLTVQMTQTALDRQDTPAALAAAATALRMRPADRISVLRPLAHAPARLPVLRRGPARVSGRGRAATPGRGG